MLAGLLVLMGLYKYVHAPLTREVASLRTELETERRRTEEMRQRYNRKTEMEKEIATLTEQLEALTRNVLPDELQPEFLVYVEEGLYDARVKINSLMLGDGVQDGDYLRFPVTAVIMGPFGAQVRFLSIIEDIPRALKVEGITMTPQTLSASEGGDLIGTAETGGEPPTLLATYDFSFLVDSQKPRGARTLPEFELSPGRADPFQETEILRMFLEALTRAGPAAR